MRKELESRIEDYAAANGKPVEEVVKLAKLLSSMMDRTEALGRKCALKGRIPATKAYFVRAVGDRMMGTFLWETYMDGYNASREEVSE